MLISSNRHRIGALLISTALVMMLAGCFTVRLVSPYDQVIDNGLKEYRQSINTFVDRMGKNFGKPDGTYEHNSGTYSELGAHVTTLLARSKINGAGLGCRITRKVTDEMFNRLGRDKVPASVRPEAHTDAGDSSGCTQRLIEILNEQLSQLEKIHQFKDPQKNMTGLRPATSKTALSIMNQAIDAAWIVEKAKREGE